MVQGRGPGGTDGSGSGNRKVSWRNVGYWMMEATKGQGIPNAIGEERVMLGIEAERAERVLHWNLELVIGSVVRDKLEVFMQERSSLRGMLLFSAGEPQTPGYCHCVSVMPNILFLCSPS